MTSGCNRLRKLTTTRYRLEDRRQVWSIQYTSTGFTMEFEKVPVRIFQILNEEQFKSVKSIMTYNLCGNRFLILVSFIPSWVARTLFQVWYHMKWFLKLYNMSHSDVRSSCLCELWRTVLLGNFKEFHIDISIIICLRCNSVTNLGWQQNELFG